jgi:hypothetical protein
MSHSITTRGGIGAWTVYFDGRYVGHVSESKKDGKFSAIRSGKVLGRFDSKVEAVDAVAQKEVDAL